MIIASGEFVLAVRRQIANIVGPVANRFGSVIDLDAIRLAAGADGEAEFPMRKTQPPQPVTQWHRATNCGGMSPLVG